MRLLQTVAGARGVAVGLLHANNVALLRLREALQTHALLVGEWDVALETAGDISRVYAVVYPTLTPAAALQVALRGKIAVFVETRTGRGGGKDGGRRSGAVNRDSLVAALAAVRRGEEALGITFGERHRVVKDLLRLADEVQMTISGHGGFVE
jgi:hypothetical protein